VRLEAKRAAKEAKALERRGSKERRGQGGGRSSWRRSSSYDNGDGDYGDGSEFSTYTTATDKDLWGPMSGYLREADGRVSLKKVSTCLEYRR